MQYKKSYQLNFLDKMSVEVMDGKTDVFNDNEKIKGLSTKLVIFLT